MNMTIATSIINIMVTTTNTVVTTKTS